MSILYGKIVKVVPHNRLITIETRKKLVSLYMTRKDFKDFGPYFVYKPYVFVETTENTKYANGVSAIEISRFLKIINPTKRIRKKDVFYDLSLIKKGVQNLLNQMEYKMFIDLEFNLPSYYQGHIHTAEIIQYGITVENKDGKIVFEEESLLRPRKPYSLNQRTLKFLNRSYRDFNDAKKYIEFYNLLKYLIKKYDPKIIAWGKSDMIAMEQSFDLNRLPHLDIKNRYLNLMQVIKNYYNIKSDMGLFSTYQELTKTEATSQSHDALEDALVLREIYRIFKDIVNKENNE